MSFLRVMVKPVEKSTHSTVNFSQEPDIDLEWEYNVNYTYPELYKP